MSAVSEPVTNDIIVDISEIPVHFLLHILYDAALRIQIDLPDPT